MKSPPGRSRIHHAVEVLGEERRHAGDPDVRGLADDHVVLLPLEEHELPRVEDDQREARVLQDPVVDLLEIVGRPDDVRRDLGDIRRHSRMAEDGAGGGAAPQADDHHATGIGMEEQAQVPHHELREQVPARRGVGLPVHAQDALYPAVLDRDRGVRSVAGEEKRHLVPRPSEGFERRELETPLPAVQGELHESGVPAREADEPDAAEEGHADEGRGPEGRPPRAGVRGEGIPERPQRRAARSGAPGPQQDDAHQGRRDRPEQEGRLEAEGGKQYEAGESRAHHASHGVCREDAADAAAHRLESIHAHPGRQGQGRPHERGGDEHEEDGEDDLGGEIETVRIRGVHDSDAETVEPVGQALVGAQGKQHGEADPQLAEREEGEGIAPSMQRPSDETGAHRDAEDEAREHRAEGMDGPPHGHDEKADPAQLVEHREPARDRDAPEGGPGLRGLVLRLSGGRRGPRNCGRLPRVFRCGRHVDEAGIADPVEEIEEPADGGVDERSPDHSGFQPQPLHHVEAAEQAAHHGSRRVDEVEPAQPEGEAGHRIDGVLREDRQRPAHEHARREDGDDGEGDLQQGIPRRGRTGRAAERDVEARERLEEHGEEEAEEADADLEQGVEPELVHPRPVGEAAEDGVAQGEPPMKVARTTVWAKELLPRKSVRYLDQTTS